MCHVLIIEDEPLVAMLIEDLLVDEGATSVCIVATEREAVAAAIDRRPAFITSDVKLAQGVGPHAVRQIHEMLGDVPVVFVTGTPADCEPCEPPGRVLTKPVDTRALAAAFHELV